MLSKKPVLAILSLIIAVFLWAYVIGEVDPETTVKISGIPVQLENEDALAARDMAVKQERQELSTSVTVKGKRSSVVQAKKNGIYGKIDVSKAKKGENELNVFFDTPAGVSVDTSATVGHITVTVESLESKELPVEVVFGETKSDGVVPYAIDCVPDMITVSGAASSIRKVSKVVASAEAFEVTEAAQEVTLDVNAVDGSNATIPGVQYDNEAINATVQMLHVQSVPVEIMCEGLNYNYEVANISSNNNVNILADEATLAGIDKITGTVDLSEIKHVGSVNKYVQLMIPENVFLEDTSYSVSIQISKKESEPNQ